jgi:ribosome modulation factor
LGRPINPPPDDADKADDQGYSAYYDGTKRASNPYRGKNDDLMNAWYDGWDDAEMDEEEEEWEDEW